jgi:uncharacterized protein
MYDNAREPRILYSGMSFRPAMSGDSDCACALEGPSAPVASPSSSLYDCDCGVVPENRSTYDCDCGIVLENRNTYDCDCGLVFDQTSRPAVPSSAPWTRQILPAPILLDGGWVAYFNPVGPVGVTTLDAEAQRVLSAFDSPLLPWQVAERFPEMSRRVVNRAVWSLARVGLLRSVVESPCLPAQPSTLSAWLHVTEACNLTCPYCYVHKSPRAMCPEVGYRAVDALMEIAIRHCYTGLKLKYAGGEPTLNFSVIQAIHDHAARRVVQAGLILDEVVLSNGVGVTDWMLDFLAMSGMRLMVSLDGGPSTHDRVRSRRDGRSTYATVADTVERALARGLRPNVSITLTAFTLEGVEEAVAFALERGLPFNVNFYRECTAGGDGPSPLVPARERLVERMLEIFDLIRLYPTYPLPLAGILDRTHVDIPHDRPCSAGQDYLAIGTTGRVSACQMLLDEPWADLADEDPLGTIRRRGEPLFNRVDEGSGCYGCQWHAACGGGCPLLRQTALHDRYCQAYRVLLPQLVRLEAGRLIAAQRARPVTCH